MRGIICQEIEHRLRHAVGTCANGQAHDVLTGQRFVIEALEYRHVTIGISVGLKVGNEFLRAITLPQKALALLELRRDRQPPISRTEAGVVTVDTATYSHGAIPVRARETSVDGDLVDTAAKHMAQMICKTHITLA